MRRMPLLAQGPPRRKEINMDKKITIEIDRFVFDKLLEYQKESKSDDIEEAIIKAICTAHLKEDLNLIMQYSATKEKQK